MCPVLNPIDLTSNSSDNCKPFDRSVGILTPRLLEIHKFIITSNGAFNQIGTKGQNIVSTPNMLTEVCCSEQNGSFTE